MADLNKLAADYFERHKDSNECHITSDGRVFHQPGTAHGYASALKDNKVEKFTRDGKAEEKEDDDKELTIADFNAETTTYPEAVALVKALGLEAKSQKKDDLFEALKEAQAKTQA
jgi:hypothetical protein